jgi:hypothetical protein
MSLALSVVLTVLLNVVLRAVPGAGRRLAQRLSELTAPGTDDDRARDRRVHVIVPWRGMLVASLVLTLLLNVLLWLL